MAEVKVVQPVPMQRHRLSHEESLKNGKVGGEHDGRDLHKSLLEDYSWIFFFLNSQFMTSTSQRSGIGNSCFLPSTVGKIEKFH